MYRFELQNKLWFWWPFLAFFVLLSLIGGTVWYLRPQAKPIEIIAHSYGSMEELTQFPKFRLAYLRANGGREQLQAIQSVRTSGLMESGGKTIPFVSLKRRPDKSLTTFKMKDYELSFVVNGDQVWQRIIMPRQAPQYELKSGEEAQGLAEMGMFFDPIMRAILFDQGTINRLLPSAWLGEEAVKLEFQSENTFIQVTAYVNIHTMHPLARIEKFSDGRIRKVLYSDYHSIDGMQEPFKVETYLDDVLQSRVIIKRSQTNVGTIPTLFEYPNKE